MNINRYTKIFIKNVMFGVGNVHLSLTNRNHVLLAVKKAYGAMQPRTYKKTSSATSISTSARRSVLSDLADRFVEYFKAPAPATQTDFDKWHRDTCEWFIREFNAKVLAPSGRASIKYGKAQKIINISFKYLYLFCTIIPGKPGHFDFCHFAIDKYIIEWYKDNICKKTGIAPPSTTWSNMDYYDYIKMQKEIRKYLALQTKYPKEPFLAEHEIWSDVRYAFGKVKFESKAE